MRLIFFAFFLITSLSFSQTGNYFLSHYSPGQDRLDNVCFHLTQHPDGTMYFATRSGILLFDGRSWQEVPANGAVYTLHASTSGQVYWGGANGFGVIDSDAQGMPYARVLSEGVRNIFQSVASNGKIYFTNAETVFQLNEGDKRATLIGPPTDGQLTGIFGAAGSTYVTTTEAEIFSISRDKLNPALVPGIRDRIVFITTYQGRTLYGTSDSKIYLQENGRSPRRITLQDQEYLNRSVVVQGAWVNDDLIALGTLRGGVVFVNITNGKTNEIVNNSKGLPDNEVFALFADQSGAVWVAHEFGFTRIVPTLPFRSFTYYSGLQGNLLCATTHRGEVFVGTSVGLFKLEKQDVYEEINYYVDATSAKRHSTTQIKSEENGDPADESKKKGLFGIFKRKDNNTRNAATSDGKGKSNEKPSRRSAAKVLKTERIYRTSNFVYRKVRGIEAKVTHLAEVNGTLIAAGLGGTFQVSGLSSSLLVEAPTRYVYGTRHGMLFVSTYADKIFCLKSKGSRWVSYDILPNVDDQITHMMESDDYLWLCSLDKIFRVKLRGEDVTDLVIIPVRNTNYDQLIGLLYQKEVIFANSSGFFRYEEKSNSLVGIDSLSEKELTNYFADGNSLWYRNVHGWKSIGTNGAARNAGLLNLFRNIRFLHPDRDTGDLWIITGSNELYKFFNDKVTSDTNPHPLMLKSVRNGEVRNDGKRIDIRFEHSSNGVTIQVVQPDYLAPGAVEYRYQLKGLDNEWSAWSNANNVIEIPYLPSGDYTLTVQSMNILGQTQGMDGLVLNVIPPYWKRPWFYGMEVMFFSFLIVLSFRLSNRYRIISRLLMLVTIIILIQLVETLIGETLETKTSPVIDFIVQVVIAMLVLPVEGFLRERMLRSLESGHRLSKFILPVRTGSDHEK